jgi:hypothetical protein
MNKTTTKTPLTLIIAAVISCQTTDDKSQKSRLLEQAGEPGLSKREYYSVYSGAFAPPVEKPILNRP